MPNKWFSAFLGFMLPPLAFVYLERFKWATIYFVLLLLVSWLDPILYGISVFAVLSWLLSMVCCIQAFQISKSHKFSEPRKWYSRWWGVFSIPIVLISVIVLFRAFLYEPFQIPSSSMLPTLVAGDYMLVSKHDYGNYRSYGITFYEEDIASRKKPKRGEMFVFYPPHDDRYFIKRVIGLPKYYIEFKDKQIIVNGQAIYTEKTDNSSIYTEQIDGEKYSVRYVRETNQYRNFKVVVPEDEYFVLGDNRDNSVDSRVWGTVQARNIVGKVIAIW